MADAVDVDAFHNGSFGGIFFGYDYVWNAQLSGADGHGKGTSNGTDEAVERELSDHQMLFAFLEDSHGAEDAHGHWEIETGTFFANVGWSQVDGDGLGGVAEARVEEGTFDSFAALADRCIGHANSDEIAGGAALSHVYLDVDEVGIDSVDCSAAGAVKGHVVEEWKKPEEFLT